MKQVFELNIPEFKFRKKPPKSAGALVRPPPATAAVVARMKSNVGQAVRRLMSMGKREWTQEEFSKKVLPSLPNRERNALIRLSKSKDFAYLKYWSLARAEDGTVVVRLNEQLFQAGRRQRDPTPQIEQTPAPTPAPQGGMDVPAQGREFVLPDDDVDDLQEFVGYDFKGTGAYQMSEDLLGILRGHTNRDDPGESEFIRRYVATLEEF